MKKLIIPIIVFCIGLCISCETLSDNTNQDNTVNPDQNGTDVINPVKGTSWICTDMVIMYGTVTYTFTETEVLCDYKGLGASAQFKAPYTYTANTVSFDMSTNITIGQLTVVWNYEGTIVGNAMFLVDSGAQKEDITLYKIEKPEWDVLMSGYENGVATLSTAGTMKALLGDDYLNITSLKIIGYINGDDIYYLRRMLGDSSYSEEQRGKLISLDLSQAVIIEGGEHYYMDADRNKYKTENGVIGKYMFYSCTNQAQIILPDNAYLIEQNAFGNCNFTSVDIGDGIASIESKAFEDCWYLTSIHIGNGLAEIKYNAFYNEPNLDTYIKDLSAWCNLRRESLYLRDLYLNGKKVENLIIPEDITDIKAGAFINCTSLKSVKIGDNVTSIGAGAFVSCPSLTSVTIGDGVRSIGDDAFYCNDSLSSVIIGKEVLVIGSLAFYGCPAGSTFHCYASTPPTIDCSREHPTFGETSEMTLYVPDRYLQSYKVSNWAEYFDEIIGE